MIIVEATNRTILRQTGGLPSDLSRTLHEKLSFANPKYLENKRRGFSTWNTPRTLYYCEAMDDGLAVPRGFTRQAIGIIKASGVPYRVDDRRRVLPEVDMEFHGTLRDYQENAVCAILARDFGTATLPTGAGKTVIALATIARRKQPTLIVVHTAELMHQWIERIGTFLGIPDSEVGIIGGGKRRVGEKITVGLVQSLAKCAEEVAPCVGFVVVDECHRAPSKTFTKCLARFDCRYVLGLSATPWRRDGLSQLIWWFVGDKIFEVGNDALVESGSILPAQVVTRETDFKATCNPSTQYGKMLSELCEDPARNLMIVDDVVQEAHSKSGVCLVLSDRKSHCETLYRMLERKRIRVSLLTGDIPMKQRQQVVDTVNGGEVKVLVATGSLVGEGFDCKTLSSLFLATPVKFSGRVIQYVGRILRPAPGKSRAVIFDYTDIHVGVLAHSAKERRKVYASA
ncbi:MAG: DEAD/DEAH box helicase [Syntrophobacteraceae bacterium]